MLLLQLKVVKNKKKQLLFSRRGDTFLMLKYDALQWQMRELSCGSDVLEFSDDVAEKSVVLEALTKRRTRTFQKIQFSETNDFYFIAKVLRIVRAKELIFAHIDCV